MFFNFTINYSLISPFRRLIYSHCFKYLITIIGDLLTNVVTIKKEKHVTDNESKW